MELITGKIRSISVPMPMPFFNLLGAGFNPSENLNSQKSKAFIFPKSKDMKLYLKHAKTVLFSFFWWHLAYLRYIASPIWKRFEGANWERSRGPPERDFSLYKPKKEWVFMSYKPQESIPSTTSQRPWKLHCRPQNPGLESNPLSDSVKFP